MAGRSEHRKTPPAGRRAPARRRWPFFVVGYLAVVGLAFVAGRMLLGPRTASVQKTAAQRSALGANKTAVGGRGSLETPGPVEASKGAEMPETAGGLKSAQASKSGQASELAEGPNAPEATTGAEVARQTKQARLPLHSAPGQKAPAIHLMPGTFYTALQALASPPRKSVVTVLHLGDSHIASDHITGELRHLLQARFGDAGRGLMMPGFPFPYYKAPGFDFAKTGHWDVADSLTDKGIYGVTGVSLTASDSHASLSVSKEHGRFASAEIEFLAGPGHGRAVITEGNARREVSTEAPDYTIRRVALSGGTGFSIAPAGGGEVTVLGWSVSSGKPGIRYINLGIPSASVLTTARWDPKLVANDIAHLKPQLVVLGYGTNGGFQDGLDIKVYEARYLALVKLIHEAAPQASLLILGPMDGATLPAYARWKGDTVLPCRPLTDYERAHYRTFVKDHSDELARWYEPPKLSAVRAALVHVAKQSHADYLDLSALMGGSCSIERWAKATPPLAMPDHVHLTDLGSQRLGKAIYLALMRRYDAYRNQNLVTGSITTANGASTVPKPTE